MILSPPHDSVSRSAPSDLDRAAFIIRSFCDLHCVTLDDLCSGHHSLAPGRSSLIRSISVQTSLKPATIGAIFNLGLPETLSILAL